MRCSDSLRLVPLCSPVADPYSLLKEAKSIETDLVNRALKAIASPLHNAFYLRSTGDPTYDKVRAVRLTL